MGALGGWEIILIVIAVLVIFGPKRLPEMGSSLGKAIREVKDASNEIKREITDSSKEIK